MYNYGMYNNAYVPYSPNSQPSYNAPNQPYGSFSASPNGFNAQANFAPQYAQNAPQTNAQNVPQVNTNKIYVTGIEDARNRTLAPNSDFIFLDNDKPLLYRKTVDATGKMEIHTFKILEYNEGQDKANTVQAAPQIDTSQFVSIKDFDRLRDDIGYDFDAVKDDIGRIKNAVNKLNQQLIQQPSKPKSDSHKDRESEGTSL